MASVVRIVAVVSVVQILNLCVGAKCVIDLNIHYSVNSPVFLDSETLDVIYPSRISPRILSFESGETPAIHCHGGYIIQENSIVTDTTTDTAECSNDLTFENLSKQPFKNLRCSERPNPVTKDSCRKRCRKCVTVSIGYQVTPSVFKKTIDLCYVPKLATTRWSHARMPGAIGGHWHRDVPAPAFSKGAYFGNVMMSQVYPKTSQYQRFMEIFEGDEELVEQYLPQDGQKRNYFAKGHLVARADLFYPSEQYSTYFYVNVLPMWQSINNGNWRLVESTVRRIAENEGDLDVWTGGLDVLNLSGRDIYLARDKRNTSKLLIPAPKLLFKLIHNPAKNEALVFVTANNPYLSDEIIPEDYQVCEEYTPCRSMLTQFERRYEGFTYCCLYEDFMKNMMVRDLDIPVYFKNVDPLTLY